MKRLIVATAIGVTFLLAGCGAYLGTIAQHHAILGGSTSCDDETVTFSIGNSESHTMTFTSNHGGGSVGGNGTTSITVSAQPGDTETIEVDAVWPQNGVTWSGSHSITVPTGCVPPETDPPDTTIPETTTTTTEEPSTTTSTSTTSPAPTTSSPSVPSSSASSTSTTTPATSAAPTTTAASTPPVTGPQPDFCTAPDTAHLCVAGLPDGEGETG